MDKNEILKLKKEVKKLLLMVERGTAKIYASVKHVSNSGMYRIIDYIIVYTDGKTRQIKEYNLAWAMDKLNVAKLTGPNKAYGVSVFGCGMDMIFGTLYHLHRVIFDDTKKSYSKTTKYSLL